MHIYVQRQRTSGRRHSDDSFYNDAASETSSVCSETSFRAGSEISDVRDICTFFFLHCLVIIILAIISSDVFLRTAACAMRQFFACLGLAVPSQLASAVLI